MNGSYIVQPGQAQAIQQEAQEATQHQQSAPRWGDSARMVGNVARITMAGGQETVENVANVSHGEYTQLTQREGQQGGILSTARSSAGRIVNGADISPNSTVKIGGMETSVAAAVAIGLLVRNADGTYSDPSAGTAPQQPTPQAQPQQDQQQQQRDQGDEQPVKVADLPAQEHQLAQEFCSRVDDVVLTSAVSTLCEGGELSDHDLTQAAGQLGLSPEAVRGQAGQLKAAYTQQAHAMVGPNAPAVFDWANQHQPEMLRAAVARHVQHEDAGAYSELKASFWTNLARADPEAIFQARNAKELKPIKERNGEITIHASNMPTRMTWAAACRAGFVNTRG